VTRITTHQHHAFLETSLSKIVVCFNRSRQKIRIGPAVLYRNVRTRTG
jgi:hypothetical protein